MIEMKDMTRRLLPLLAAAALALSCSISRNEGPGPLSGASLGPGFRAAAPGLPVTVAHRGCWLKEGKDFYINENCVAGVLMAARYGYPAIECDVKYTRDSVMVLMHDETINRTMRNASDYSPIGEPVRVRDLAFGELRSKYVLASTDPSLRVPIPTLEELLAACREYGVVPMLHSEVVDSYRLAHDMLGDGFIAFSASQRDVSHARDWSEDCLVLLDPGRDDAPGTISRLAGIGGPCGMSTMKYGMLDSAYIAAVKAAGFDVQASIFPSPHEQRAVLDGVTIQLSDFWWFQPSGRKVLCSERKKGIRMTEGDSFSWNPEVPDFCAVTIEVEFEGSLEVSLAGRVYVLSGGKGAVPVGTRLYKERPDVRVKALSDSRIKSFVAKVHDCGPTNPER